MKNVKTLILSVTTAILIVTGSLFYNPVAGMADDIVVMVLKKEEQKKNRGWNLTDWLLTKQKMSLMDQWLSLHSSATVFEGIIGENYQKYKLNAEEIQDKEQEAKEGQFSLFVTILGIELSYNTNSEYDKSTTMQGQVVLRIFGRSIQGTHITIHYGYQQKKIENSNDTTQNDTFKNYYLGGDLNFYLMRYFGLEGLYRLYSKNKSENGVNRDGFYSEYGAFLDIRFVRLYGDIFKEKNYYSFNDPNSGITSFSTDIRRGFKVGIKIFF
ncbi:MAG: hypothetical protein HQK53_03180 [Oligoflexia bacterium]|nr:hypothetical protein [Oligoflexia bacterium]